MKNWYSITYDIKCNKKRLMEIINGSGINYEDEVNSFKIDKLFCRYNFEQGIAKGIKIKKKLTSGGIPEIKLRALDNQKEEFGKSWSSITL